MDGLGKDFEFVAFCAGLLQKVGRGSLTGEEQDFALRQSTACDDRGFDTGHAGHDDVADEHVGLEGLDRLDGLLSTKDCTRLKACLIQDNCERVGNYLFVIGDEYSGF